MANMFGTFGGRDRAAGRETYGDRLPPGQRVDAGWPVLHYGGIPRIDLANWTFRVWGEVEQDLQLSHQEFMALPKVTPLSDIHCVTGWSKFDNRWEGVGFQEVIKLVQPKPQAGQVMVHSYGGYMTNVSLTDLMAPGVLFAYKHNGLDLAPEHGWPVRLVVPHLYFWKSAKWVSGLEFMTEERAGFWESYGYHIHGDPWSEERYS